jgi:hypothetical protein
MQFHCNLGKRNDCPSKELKENEVTEGEKEKALSKTISLLKSHFFRNAQI